MNTYLVTYTIPAYGKYAEFNGIVKIQAYFGDEACKQLTNRIQCVVNSFNKV